MVSNRKIFVLVRKKCMNIEEKHASDVNIFSQFATKSGLLPNLIAFIKWHQACQPCQRTRLPPVSQEPHKLGEDPEAAGWDEDLQK